MAEETVELDTRGQLSVTLGGAEYMLRPSFEAIEKAELQLKKSHEQLAHDAVQMRLTYEELAVLCCEFMKAHARANPSEKRKTSYLGATPEKLKKLIYEGGKVKTNARIVILLTGALNGGYTAEGEAVTAGTNTEATPAAE